MALVDALVCPECGRSFPDDAGPTTCPDHEAGGALAVQYDETRVTTTLPSVADGVGESLWQFDPILPTGEERVHLGAGGTPLLASPTLATDLGVGLRLKDETGNPTGSIKDRSSAVLISRAAGESGVVSCASTGNQAASVAAYAARAGLDCRVFVPGDVPEGKAVQPLVSGAEVYAVDGDYDDAVALCREVSEERGWRDCSAGIDPFGMEGLRTVGLEIGAASSRGVPDWVVVPMGNGSTLAAAWKGLREWAEYGPADRTPRLLGVQAAGADAIHRRFTGESGDGNGTTVDSIDVGRPNNAYRACDALEASDGASVVVPDDAILAAERTLGRAEGVYVEPASAATIAGLRTAIADGIVTPGADVVCVLTGSGLKDTNSARTLSDGVQHVPADPVAIPDES